jgi:hypothetical protein
MFSVSEGWQRVQLKKSMREMRIGGGADEISCGMESLIHRIIESLTSRSAVRSSNDSIAE